MLFELHQGVTKAIKAGKKVEDIPALNLTAKYDDVFGRGFIKGKDFILVVANELAAQKTKK